MVSENTVIAFVLIIINKPLEWKKCDLIPCPSHVIWQEIGCLEARRLENALLNVNWKSLTDESMYILGRMYINAICQALRPTIFAVK